MFVHQGQNTSEPHRLIFIFVSFLRASCHSTKDFGDHGVSVGDIALNLDDGATSCNVGANFRDGAVGIPG